MIVYFITPPITILYHSKQQLVNNDQYISSLPRFYEPRRRHNCRINETHVIFKRNVNIDRSKTRILTIFLLLMKQFIATNYQLSFNGFFCVSRIYTKLRCGKGLHIGRFDNIYLGVGQDFWIFSHTCVKEFFF